MSYHFVVCAFHSHRAKVEVYKNNGAKLTCRNFLKFLASQFRAQGFQWGVVLTWTQAQIKIFGHIQSLKKLKDDKIIFV